MNKSKFKIDKNIAMPEGTKGTKYPFAQMAVGDSFAVSVEDRPRVANSAIYFKKRHGAGVDFSVQKHGDAYRCWRTA